jgi:hypothetical protein
MSLQNPLGLNGPGPNLPYVQPDAPGPPRAVSPLVASYPRGADVLGVDQSIPKYGQPGTTYAALSAAQLAGGPMGISNNHER